MKIRNTCIVRKYGEMSRNAFGFMYGNCYFHFTDTAL